ncbi:MAG: MFS transporter [Chloroflexota bacterium]
MLGYGPRQVGLLIAAVPILMGVTAPISGTLSDRYGTRPIATVGLVILVAGYLAMSRFTTNTSLLVYILAVLPFGAGMGIFQSPNNSAVMGSVPPQQLGIASGLLATTRNLGQTMGIAILGAVWASRVMAAAGETISGGATAAPVAAQIAGLQDTFTIIAILISMALALSAYGLVQERRKSKA